MGKKFTSFLLIIFIIVPIITLTSVISYAKTAPVNNSVIQENNKTTEDQKLVTDNVYENNGVEYLAAKSVIYISSKYDLQKIIDLLTYNSIGTDYYNLKPDEENHSIYHDYYKIVDKGSEEYIIKEYFPNKLKEHNLEDAIEEVNIDYKYLPYPNIKTVTITPKEGFYEYAEKHINRLRDTLNFTVEKSKDNKSFVINFENSNATLQEKFDEMNSLAIDAGGAKYLSYEYYNTKTESVTTSAQSEPDDKRKVSPVIYLIVVIPLIITILIVYKAILKRKQ